MIRKGDIIKICNRKYSKDDEQKEITAEEYYIISKVESGTLIVKKIEKPAAGRTIYRVSDLGHRYSIYVK